MNQNDTIQRFIFENSDVRGEIVHLGQSLQTILGQHAYPPVVQTLLSQSLLAASLLCSIIKFKGSMTLQFRSTGPVKLLVAKCDHHFHIRGMAQWDEASIDSLSDDIIKEGNVVVSLQADDKVKPYQSIIPIEHCTIAQALENYFAQSEQIATRIYFASQAGMAAGLLLQLLPEKAIFQQRETIWEHATTLADTLTEHELLNLDNLHLLHRLYHQDEVRIFEAKTLMFRCTCNANAMENAIKTLGKTEAEDIIATEGVIRITCEFCNKTFEFDKIDVAKIFL